MLSSYKRDLWLLFIVRRVIILMLLIKILTPIIRVRARDTIYIVYISTTKVSLKGDILKERLINLVYKIPNLNSKRLIACYIV